MIHFNLLCTVGLIWINILTISEIKYYKIDNVNE